MLSLRAVSTSSSPSTEAPRSRRQRFLGEDLSPDPLTGGPWLVKAVLGGARLEITRDGVIPPRPSRILPLRHGLSGVGLPATCLLTTPGLTRLRVGAAGADTDVECAACRAWQKKHGISPKRPVQPMMGRLRAALEELAHAATAW